MIESEKLLLSYDSIRKFIKNIQNCKKYSGAMFSEELIDQLSQIIIRPHREIYGLDRLGPKKLIVKNIGLGTYM